MVEVLNFMGILSKYWNKHDFMLLTVFKNSSLIHMEQVAPAWVPPACSDCSLTFYRFQSTFIRERDRDKPADPGHIWQGWEERACAPHLPWLIQTQGFTTVTLNLDQEGWDKTLVTPSTAEGGTAHSRRDLQIYWWNLFKKKWQGWAQKTSPRGLFTNLIQNSCEPELITIYHQHSWIKHHLTILYESV